MDNLLNSNGLSMLFQLFLINGQPLWPLRELVWIALYLLFSFYQVEVQWDMEDDFTLREKKNHRLWDICKTMCSAIRDSTQRVAFE